MQQPVCKESKEGHGSGAGYDLDRHTCFDNNVFLESDQCSTRQRKRDNRCSIRQSSLPDLGQRLVVMIMSHVLFRVAFICDRHRECIFSQKGERAV